jgi:hypothetical protein
MTPDTNNYEDIGELCVELEHQNEQLANEVERLDQMVERFIENAPHFTLAQFNEHQRTLNSTDK